MKKNLAPILIIIAALVVAVFIVRPDFSAFVSGLRESALSPRESALEEENDGSWVIMSNGLRAELPRGRFITPVVQASEIWPKILEAEINPLDVVPGQTQKLSVKVQGPDAITSVVAHIETDNGFRDLPLTLAGEVEASELMPIPYAIDDQNKLVLLGSPQPRTATRSGGGVALAADPPIYLYSGEWVVDDVHERAYITEFIVKDAANRENSVTMAWTDACGIPNSGAWTMSSNCTLPANDGVEAGNVTLSSGTLALSGNNFFYNPGQSISLSGASIAVGTGQIQQKYVCGLDADSDLYSPNSSITGGNNSNCSDVGASYKRRSSISGQGDCYDSNANAKPGQTSYFTTARGDGSFDYNCDSVASKLTSSYTVCNTILAAQGSCDLGGDCESQCSADGTNTPSCGGSYFTGIGTCQGETDLGCAPGGPGCPAGSRTGNCAYDSLAAATVSCR